LQESALDAEKISSFQSFQAPAKERYIEQARCPNSQNRPYIRGPLRWRELAVTKGKTSLERVGNPKQAAPVSTNGRGGAGSYSQAEHP
jgi:hypothetical protein